MFLCLAWLNSVADVLYRVLCMSTGRVESVIYDMNGRLAMTHLSARQFEKPLKLLTVILGCSYKLKKFHLIRGQGATVRRTWSSHCNDVD